MSRRALEKKLAQARKAYARNDKRNGARLIDEVLQQDFNHPGAWNLLYQLYGGDQPFESFRQTFSARYFPERLPLLSSAKENPPPTSNPSLISRLFGRRGKTSAATEQEAAISPPAILAGAQAQPSSGGMSTNITSAASASPERALPPELIGTESGGSSRSAENIRILVVDDVAQTRETVIRTLRFQDNFNVVGAAANGLQAIQLVRQLKPDVVVMDVNMPDMDGIAATAAIKRDSPVTEVVILTVQDDLDYMHRAMLAGARDFLAKPPMIDELVQAVERAGELAQYHRQRAPLIPASAPSVSAKGRGRIIVCYSPRGGSGCTVLAANLAIGLHRQEMPAVIVDADLHFGDVPVLLNTRSQLSILDLAPRVDDLDPEIVQDVLMEHPTGLKVLQSSRPERAELVTGEQLGKLCRYLSELFAYVVVDTPHRLNETTLAALDAAHLILLVSTLDIPSISRTRKFIDLVPLLNLDLRRVLLVVNQFDPRIGIPPEKLPEAFGLPPVGLIPFAYPEVSMSVNNGIPLLARRESAQRPTGQALLAIARQVRGRLRELDKAAPQEMFISR